jgi:hypothetical protein
MPSDRTHECPKKGILDVHALVFSTYLDEWRWYLDDIGNTCKDLVSNTPTERRAFLNIGSKTEASLLDWTAKTIAA